VRAAVYDPNSIYGKAIQSKEITVQERKETVKVCLPMLSAFGNCIGVVFVKIKLRAYVKG